MFVAARAGAGVCVCVCVDMSPPRCMSCHVCVNHVQTSHAHAPLHSRHHRVMTPMRVYICASVKVSECVRV